MRDALQKAVSSALAPEMAPDECDVVTWPRRDPTVRGATNPYRKRLLAPIQGRSWWRPRRAGNAPRETWSGAPMPSTERTVACVHASLAAPAHSLGAGAEAILVWHAGLLRFHGKVLGEQATNQPMENVIDNQCSDPSVFFFSPRTFLRLRR